VFVGLVQICVSLLQEKFITSMHVPWSNKLGCQITGTILVPLDLLVFKFHEDSCTHSLRGHNFWMLCSTNNLWAPSCRVWGGDSVDLYSKSMNYSIWKLWPLIFLMKNYASKNSIALLKTNSFILFTQMPKPIHGLIHYSLRNSLTLTPPL